MMLFKREKTKQEQFLDELYWDSHILKEMISSYKKDRKMLLNLLRDRIRHTQVQAVIRDKLQDFDVTITRRLTDV